MTPLYRSNFYIQDPEGSTDQVKYVKSLIPFEMLIHFQQRIVTLRPRRVYHKPRDKRGCWRLGQNGPGRTGGTSCSEAVDYRIGTGFLTDSLQKGLRNEDIPYVTVRLEKTANPK
jgi:hypothetical protein